MYHPKSTKQIPFGASKKGDGGTSGGNHEQSASVQTVVKTLDGSFGFLKLESDLGLPETSKLES